MKPILFNTEMVQAILDGRKTTTRRVIKPQPEPFGKAFAFKNGIYATLKVAVREAPYQPDDIIYVRETWYKDAGRYMFKANYSDSEKFYRAGKEIVIKWHPSIHMPREAARIFLRVTGVRVERLQGITEEQAVKEGFVAMFHKGDLKDNPESEYTAKDEFLLTFEEIYPTQTNPWVWVIEFERVVKPDA